MAADDYGDDRIRRGGASRPTAVPLLPFLAAVFMTLALVQGFSWLWEHDRVAAPPGDLGGSSTEAPVRPAGAPPEPPPVQAVPARRVVMPARDTNLQFGDPNAKVVVTILSDPACGDCREQVRAWTDGLPKSVRTVYKFWPRQPGRLTPGMLLELARREGVVGPFLTKLEAAEGDLDDTQLLALLDNAGVPLDKQRTALSDPETRLSDVLEDDIAKAQFLKLPPPPLLLVNGYVLDGLALKPANLKGYVERLQRNEPLVKAKDMWLMER